MTFLFLILLLAVLCSAVDILPDYIPKCKRNDPEIDKCFMKSIENLRPRLSKGIPEIGIPGIDPLYLEEIELANGKDSTKLKLYGRKIEVHGPSKFVLEDLKFVQDPKKPEFKVKLSIGHMHMIGEYDLSAQLVLIPIKGNGKIDVNLTDSSVDAIIYGHLYRKGGKEYMQFIKADMELIMKDFNIVLDNLFNNEPTIAAIANRLINDNKPEIAQTLNPVIAKAASKILLDISNKILGVVEYDTLFPIS